MITRTSAEIAVGGVLRHVDGRPPLTLRRLRFPPVTSPRLGDADLGTCALCLVGSAAGPLAGDDLVVSLRLDPGAHATLQATGAHLAQGREGQARSRLRCSASLGAGAALVADPGPLVVCAGAAVDVEVRLEIGPGASVDWTELVVLGREGEPPVGRAGLRWDVVRCHSATLPPSPLLRQRLDLADPELAGWSGLLRGRRVLGSRLLVGPGVHARTVVDSPFAVAQQLDSDAVLITVLADDTVEAARGVANLGSRVLRAEPGHGHPVSPGPRMLRCCTCGSSVPARPPPRS